MIFSKLKYGSDLINKHYKGHNLGHFLQNDVEKHGLFASSGHLFYKVVFYDSSCLLSFEEIIKTSESAGRIDQQKFNPILYIEVVGFDLLFDGIAFQNVHSSTFFLETKLIENPEALRIFCRVNVELLLMGDIQ